MAKASGMAGTLVGLKTGTRSTWPPVSYHRALFSACFATTSKILSTCSMGFLLFFRMVMIRKLVYDINQDFVVFLNPLLDPFAQHTNGVIVDFLSFTILPFIVDFLDYTDNH
jgi:hypothetical protein